MLKVSPLKDETLPLFTALFKAYYAELGCEDDAETVVEDYVVPDLLAGLLRVDVVEDDGAPAGFVIYQRDEIDNDWNFKEGWGDIREIYVHPSFRRKGLGRFLLYTAEMRLDESGTERAYCLPTPSALPFFKACGYADCGEYDEETDCPVYIKPSLKNGCGERKARK